MSSRAGAVISSTSSEGPRTTRPGAAGSSGRRAASKRTEVRMPSAIAPLTRPSGGGVLAAEVAVVVAAGDVDGAPASSAADEGGTQLERDTRRARQLAVASAALGMTTGRIGKDADGYASAGRNSKRVDVLSQILASDDHRSDEREAVMQQLSRTSLFIALEPTRTKYPRA